MSELESGAHWLAVAGYAAAALAAGGGVALGRERVVSAGVWLLGLGALANLLALGARWLAVGHGPYLGRYEAFSSHALAVAALFLLLQSRVPALRAGTFLVAPAAFLLLGVAVLSPTSPTFPSPALRSPWLAIHVSIAKLALATTLATGAVAALRLARGRLLPRRRPRAPGRDEPSLDLLAYRLLSYTFFLMSMVILSGSLWASAAWGSFWSWDPVETWSLAFWAACAFVLHLRRAGTSSGPSWARWVAGLTVLGIVSFLGYGHFGISVHAAYVAP